MKYSRCSRISMMLLCVFLMAAQSVDARSLLERKMFYIEDGKVGECKFWDLFLGNYECTLIRKYPGEGEIPVKVSINLSMLSSGYIEGNGYSEKGRITAKGKLVTGSDSAATRPLMLDSLDYVYANGAKVKPISAGESGLFIDVDGVKLELKGLQLRIYNLVNEYGADVLKNPTEKTISAFSFTKEGAQRALKATNGN